MIRTGYKISNVTYKVQDKLVQVHGNGLFSKEEVTVSIKKVDDLIDIVFILNNERILANIRNVTSTNRNTVLSNSKESICLVEHFLAACSILGVDGIEVETNKNELVFGDGSALHWSEVFSKANLICSVKQKYDLKEVLFIKDKNGNKEIVAIPHDGFKVSYFMDWNHIALGKLWASWEVKDGPSKILPARTFGTKEENEFFGAQDNLLTLNKDGFNNQLHEPLEPVYHKILDIIGDLRLSSINPLEINMHVIGFKSGHTLNIELAKLLQSSLIKIF